MRRVEDGERIGPLALSNLTPDHQIWFFTLCDQDEAADLNAEEKKALKKAIQAELEARKRKS